MLHPFLHPIANTLFATTGFVLLIGSLQVFADTQSFIDSSRAGNVRTMSSVDLLNNSEYTLDESEQNRRLMNAMWLESGMQESAEDAEGHDALRTLAKQALKTYWKALVRKDPGYDRYTPVVQGNFSVMKGGADFDLHLSGNTIKFRVEYAF